MKTTEMKDGFTIRISTNYMYAYLDIFTKFENGEAMYDNIMKELANYNVVYGILRDKLHKICTEKQPVIDILIAEGSPAIDGSDAEISFCFDVEHHIAPKINEDGSVNYKDMHFFEGVKENDILANIHVATDGINGENIVGDEIVAKKGEEKVVSLGNNCSYTEDGSQIIAGCNGAIVYENEILSVSDVLEIDEDVGAGTGDINFTGNVIVHGSILTGMKVKCKNLRVDDVIEGAKVIVSGDLEIRNGIQGKDTASINVHGNLKCKYIHGAKVYVGGNIETDIILNSEVSCDRNIKAKGRKGTIIGSVIKAKGNIKAKSIGSMMGISTIIYLGENTALLQEMHKVEREIKELEEIYKKTEQCLEVLVEKLKEQPTNETYRELNGKYTRNKYTAHHEINKKNQTLLRLHTKITESSILEIEANKLYADTHIYIGDDVLDLVEDKEDIIIQSVHGHLFVKSQRAS